MANAIVSGDGEGGAGSGRHELSGSRGGYLRAAGRAPMALYDPAVAIGMRERTFRGRLVRQVLAGWAGDGRRAGVEIVEVGCGTGSLALALAAARGAAAVVAIDGDPGALARARRKEAKRGGGSGGRAGAPGPGAAGVGAGGTGAGDAGAGDAGAGGAIAGGAGAGGTGAGGTGAVDWREGMAQALPLADASCDRVVMSLLLHHLSPRDHRTALSEAARVLRPGGRIHVADWGPPRDPLMRLAFRGLQLIDGVESTAPLGRGELPALLDRAGFGCQRLHDRLRTGGGVLELRSARRG